MPITIRPASPNDAKEILRLNEESVHFLSPLDAESLLRLASMAEIYWVAEEGGKLVAFMLAFREGKDYASPNYQWFARKYPRFIYVDRVVVCSTQRAKGIGKALYDAALAHARKTGVNYFVCEYDLEPPNPASEKFHAGFGFTEVGRQWVADGKKCVSLQALTWAES